MNAERARLEDAQAKRAPWKKWGPYMSERQWRTVREDYSETGDAWNYFTHDHARSRAYRWGEDGLAGISVLGSILNEANLRRVLKVMLDEEEFLSPFGIRALSRVHRDHPYVYRVRDQEYRVSYLPGDSDNAMFGGNSNWRGPIWMPVNLLILRALLQYHLYYGSSFTIECPTGSGKHVNLYEVAEEIARRLSRIFLKDAQGRRPVHGTSRKFQEDPHWREYPLFYEYFHGDTGAGVGASHQTGWTGAIARLMHLFGSSDAQEFLEHGKDSSRRRTEQRRPQ
jgi:hypothetical protein